MKKILVVDDEKNICLLYNKEFSAEGYEVITATEISEAEKLFFEGGVNLVILDIKLTEDKDGGLELLRKMREKDKTVPIILNTAYPSYKAEFSTWLADAYIIKSGNLAELKTKVKELLRK
ncbi:MAG: response regulator [Candidatus Edwardsbacteria bacterium]